MIALREISKEVLKIQTELKVAESLIDTLPNTNNETPEYCELDDQCMYLSIKLEEIGLILNQALKEIRNLG